MNQSQGHIFFWTLKCNVAIAALLILGGTHDVLRAELANCGPQFPLPDDEPDPAVWCRDAVHEHSFEVKTLRSARKRFKNPVSKNATRDENQCFNWATDGTRQYSASCSCDEFVENFRLIGETKAISKINAAEASEAKSIFCTDQYSLASRAVWKINVTQEFASKVVRSSTRFHQDGGSCHGEFSFETYALRSGHNYKLSEVLNKTTKAALQDTLLSSFSHQYVTKWEGKSKYDHMSAEKNQKIYQIAISGTSRYLASMNIAETGFVIDRNKIWINIPEFLFSCAEGNLYPVSLPSRLITLEFQKQLEKNTSAQAQ
jgi:hypothetical protein